MLNTWISIEKVHSLVWVAWTRKTYNYGIIWKEMLRHEELASRLAITPLVVEKTTSTTKWDCLIQHIRMFNTKRNWRRKQNSE
jgi:hypothetical protein